MANIILKSTLDTTGVQLVQDSKSGMFNVTEMFNSANEVLGLNKRLDHYLTSKQCKELLDYRKSLIISHLQKLEETDNQEVTKEQEKVVENQILKVSKSKQT